MIKSTRVLIATAKIVEEATSLGIIARVEGRPWTLFTISRAEIGTHRRLNRACGGGRSLRHPAATNDEFRKVLV